jgi:hypothetical protein
VNNAFSYQTLNVLARGREDKGHPTTKHYREGEITREARKSGECGEIGLNVESELGSEDRSRMVGR